MKRIAILAGVALFASAAHADPVTVQAPTAPISQEAAEAYVNQLDRAVKTVCLDAAGPLIGVGYYSYLECLKQTRLEVAQKDPTGLFAARESTGELVIAAK